jgi:uncharacterized protein YcgL (UPF0745 family)
MNAEDAMCEALLVTFGLGRNIETTLTDARDQIRSEAQEVIEDLAEQGWVLTPRTESGQ